MIEKLETKLEKVQKKSETIIKATAQENLRMDEAAVDIFSQCIEAVKAEVKQRKEEQTRKLNPTEGKSVSVERQGSPDRKERDSLLRQKELRKGTNTSAASNFIYFNDSSRTAAKGPRERELSPKLLTQDKFKILELFVNHKSIEKTLKAILGQEQRES